MPSGRTVIVERVVNGQLDERFRERVAEASYVVFVDDDEDPTTVHIVMGTQEDLEGVEIEVPKEEITEREKREKEQAKVADKELAEAKKESAERQPTTEVTEPTTANPASGNPRFKPKVTDAKEKGTPRSETAKKIEERKG